jgi:[acyl-carrier-protein] S-malonyltransferase
MAAVMGLETAGVVAACEQASNGGVAVAANLNAPDQVVISGDPAAVRLAGEGCRAAGAKRVIPLKVSGAFHSPLMAPAVPGLEQALAAVSFADPTIPVVANATARAVETGNQAREQLAAQLTAPVRWVESMHRAAELAEGGLFLELGPGRVLSGLLKRIVPGAEARALGTAQEVEEFLA